MINIFKLNKKRDQKELNKSYIYKKILNRIHNKIKSTSHQGVPQMVYVIPKVIIGLPIFDQINCAVYCVEKLRANGFIVYYTFPNLLFISWEHVPSTLKNPQFKPIAYEILTKPERDYSQIIQRISNFKNQKKIKY